MNIYLTKTQDDTYTSTVSAKAHHPKSVFITKEGQYPTVAWHQRHDLNMCTILMQETIHNREELLEYLNWQGQCRNKIIKLWDFDVDETENSALIQLFAAINKRKTEVIYNEMLEACEDFSPEDMDRETTAESADDSISF
jgi:hypothetical protein